MTDILWQPSASDLQDSHMAGLLALINQHHQLSFDNYANFHAWSISEKSLFWQAVCDYTDIQLEQPATTIFTPGNHMRNAHWFKGASLNFAQNLLSRDDDHIAIRYADENGARQTLTYRELKHAVLQLAAYLKQLGVGTHDRVAGFMTNRPETVIAMLASTLIGATWSACSPDFGLEAMVDRFEQIQPKVLFAVTTHQYNGKVFEHSNTLKQLQQRISSIKNIITIDDWPHNNEILTDIDSFDFDHPLYILYSSGTTGLPKCMVHSSGGTLIQHLKELKCHSDIHADDTLFFYTTCGWMMWHWMVSTLAVGATIVLYDGAPMLDDNKAILFDLIDEFHISHFGAGAKFYESCDQLGVSPISTHQLDQVRCILSTGSPLMPSSFDYLHTRVKTDARVSSISGGSDIISCFALGNPMLPVYRGEIQCIGLGMDVHIFDDNGNNIIAQKGELVCKSPFPSMPIYFWNDPDSSRYQHAYFDQFPGVWTHGDYAEITQHGGMIIYGRSDATLNPRGVRIGTAELYRQIDHIPEVKESLAVGHQHDGNEDIILFVILKPESTLDQALIMHIKDEIRTNCSPLHVPTHIFQVADFPRTMSGKVAEISVKHCINNLTVKNKAALINPTILLTFNKIAQILNQKRQ